MSDINVPVKAGPEGGTQLETILDVDPSKIPPKPVEDVKILHVFKSTMPNVNVHASNGEALSFQQGRFVTDNEAHIALLNQAVKDRHPHIFIDPLEITVRSDMVTPMQQMRAKIIAEYIAEQAAKENPSRQMGHTEQNLKLNVAGSNQMANENTPGAGQSQLAPTGTATLIPASKLTLSK